VEEEAWLGLSGGSASTSSLFGTVKAVPRGLRDVSDPLGLLRHPQSLRIAGGIAQTPAEAPILQGFLRKSGRSGETWRRRWFVLYRSSLSYLKSRDAPRAQGAVPLAAVGGLDCGSPDAPLPVANGFRLHTPGRTYALEAPSESALRHWLHALAGAIVHWHTAERDAPHALSSAGSAARTAPRDLNGVLA
jgi:hypothetical protein